MALTVVKPPISSQKSKEELPAKSSQLITPVGDPWPRPFILRDGLRRVAPYHFTYNTYCKERWRGREVFDVFSTEFRDRSPEYYKHAIETGKVLINGKNIPSPSTKLRNGDIITHTLHRHEPPVTAEGVGIIHEDNDLIVINKPAGIPVHPTGRYNYNSVTEILRSTRSYTFNPLPCNRLDRLTSGVMFIGKHREAADKMTVAIKKRSVRKEYLARVVGEFPEGEVMCDKPILQISPRLGLNQVRANGKEARTVFRRLAYYPPKDEFDEAHSNGSSNSARQNEDVTISGLRENGTRDCSNASMPWKSHRGYSIVHCLPLTGRTHQIRVHLQFLGHPISNDPIYANQRVFGPNLGAGFFNDPNINDNAAGIADTIGDITLENGEEKEVNGKAARTLKWSYSDESLISRLEKMGKHEVADAVAYHSEIRSAYEERKAEKMSGEMCEICGTPLYSDPGVHELGIYLHALRYEDLDGHWGFESKLPGWAIEEGQEELQRRITGVREELKLPVNLERLDLRAVEAENGETLAVKKER